MKANNLKLNSDKKEFLLVGSHSVLGSGSMPTLTEVALTPKLLVHNLGVLLDPGLLLEAQVVTAASGEYHHVTFPR